MRETELWARLSNIIPYAERVENAIKVGTPDVFYPTKMYSWRGMELKMLEADNCIFVQKTQLAYSVRINDLPERFLTAFVIWDSSKDVWATITSKYMLGCKREVVSDKAKYVRVRLPAYTEWCDKFTLLSKLDVYSSNRS